MISSNDESGKRTHHFHQPGHREHGVNFILTGAKMCFHLPYWTKVWRHYVAIWDSTIWFGVSFSKHPSDRTLRLVRTLSIPPVVRRMINCLDCCLLRGPWWFTGVGYTTVCEKWLENSHPTPKNLQKQQAQTFHRPEPLLDNVARQMLFWTGGAVSAFAHLYHRRQMD